ncbi:hypothetical protein, partial [Phytoactinopolyspora endophytica]|uniref:hypothetical protein n=1 Tax=Phytoactinopolyspora endophytica TaxID=1642495 RepID=UPI0013EC7249
NVDVAPTLLALHGVDHESLDGRVLYEALADGVGAAAGTVTVDRSTYLTEATGAPYRAAIQTCTVDGVRYIDKSWRLPDR